MWRDITEIQSNFSISRAMLRKALELGLKDAKVRLKRKDREGCVEVLQYRLSIACGHLNYFAGKVAQGIEPKWFQDVMKDPVEVEVEEEKNEERRGSAKPKARATARRSTCGAAPGGPQA